MKTESRSSTLALVVFAFSIATSVALSAAPPTHETLVGTWQLVSIKYGDATTWEDVSSDQRKLKILNATHFVWAASGAADGKILSSAGGSYTLTGDTYTEVIEFGDEEMIPLRGKKQTFTLSLEGDRLQQSGQLSNGFKIDEIWQRVK